MTSTTLGTTSAADHRTCRPSGSPASPRTSAHVHAVRGIDLEPRAGRDRGVPRPQRRRQDHDHRHGARTLTSPRRGEVEVLGLQPRAAIARGLVSAVMQTGGLLKDLTVRETVRYTASLFADTEDVDTVLAKAGITGIADRKVGKCSGGEQQRLRFAMALLSDPALLLLDEPTTGMDVEGRRAFWSAIREDAALGRTVLFATHYLEEADQYADRIVLDQQGPDRRRRHGRPGQGDGRRPHGAGDAAGRRPRGPPRARRARRRRRRRDPRGVGDRAGQGQRRRRPLPAHRDRRPRPRDHRARSRGGLPQPHRRPGRTRRRAA